MQKLQSIEAQLQSYYHEEERQKKYAYKIYNNIIMLRKNIDKNKYNKLKELNKSDKIYSWAFNNDDVLKEDISELKGIYNWDYIKDILLVYEEILYNCQKEVVKSDI